MGYPKVITMFDTRCWNCAVIGDTKVESIQEMEYQGSGVFKCPKCKEVCDFSKNIFKMTIKKGKDFFVVSKCDARLNRDARIQIQEDLWLIEGDFDIEGEYECDVYWSWYLSGGEEPEWDVDMEIISPIPPTPKKAGILEAI